MSAARADKWWKEDRQVGAVAEAMRDTGEATAEALEQLAEMQEKLAAALARWQPDNRAAEAMQAALAQLADTQAKLGASLEKLAKLARPEAPVVRVAAPVVNVAAPEVRLQPNITLPGPRACSYVCKHSYNMRGDLVETTITPQEGGEA